MCNIWGGGGGGGGYRGGSPTCVFLCISIMQHSLCIQLNISGGVARDVVFV